MNVGVQLDIWLEVTFITLSEGKLIKHNTTTVNNNYSNQGLISLQNLTFDAYFKSTVNESFGCSYNLRKCKIIYFLEDDTIKVVEPIVINSGLPQGIY